MVLSGRFHTADPVSGSSLQEVDLCTAGSSMLELKVKSILFQAQSTTNVQLGTQSGPKQNIV